MPLLSVESESGSIPLHLRDETRLDSARNNQEAITMITNPKETGMLPFFMSSDSPERRKRP
jgi:hypothetical protein